MANSWINHVKEFSSRKKMKYTDALKSADCKAEYQEKKPKSSDEMKQEMNKVIVKAPRKKKDTSLLKPVEMPTEIKTTIVPQLNDMNFKKPRARTSKVSKEPM